MVKQNYGYAQISELLGVSLGFISNYKQEFLNNGIEGLKLKYQGSKAYLSSQQKQEIIQWLEQKDYWQLSELKTQIEVSYGVENYLYSICAQCPRTYAKRYPLGKTH
jgi:putative transposase